MMRPGFLRGLGQDSATPAPNPEDVLKMQVVGPTPDGETPVVASQTTPSSPNYDALYAPKQAPVQADDSGGNQDGGQKHKHHHHSHREDGGGMTNSLILVLLGAVVALLASRT